MNRPRICLSLYGTTDEVCTAINSFDADLFEIRLDLCAHLDGAKIRAATNKPLLFASHGRPDLLEKYWPFADYLDVEQGEALGQNCIVSIHAKEEDPDSLWKKLSGEHRTKIVLETENYDVIARLIKLNRENNPLALCFAAGEVGAFSRILSVFNGARWIYASLPGRPTGNGQFDFDQLVETYRLRRFENTQQLFVFGVIGNPVAHSRSPEVQNKHFADASLPWIYLPYFCKDLPALMRKAPEWNTKGFSITHPYKEEVLSLVNSVTPEVQRLRACNTVAQVKGKWIGTNTDLKGIEVLLKDIPVQGACAVIIGAGASARALASVISAKVSELWILNRTLEKAQRLASEFQAISGGLADLRNIDYDVLIQATSIGWISGECPVDIQHLKPGGVVIDSIYQDTELLKRARDLGCRTLNGEPWFQAQAQAQFRWWSSLNL
ncbi:type I 3-dehydroquinate dehydratase [bacterium]|nr:type I 3-dehydroquinate dehydratase [bacterium]